MLANFSSVLGVVGPLLAAGGAGLLGYDVLRNPVRWYQQVYFPRGYLRAEERVHKLLLDSLGRYSDEERERMRKEEDERYSELVNMFQKGLEQQDLKERLYSRKLAFWGFFLVFVGSLMQAAAAFLSR